MNWSFGGWWRVGIVLTVLWVAAASYYVKHFEEPVAANELRAFSFQVADAYSACINRNNADKAKCELSLTQGLAREADRAKHARADSLRHMGLFALLPLPVFWILGYGLLISSRWVRVGFADPRRAARGIVPHRASGKSQPIWSIRGWWGLALALSIGWLVAVPAHFVLVVQPGSVAAISSWKAFFENEYGDCRAHWQPAKQPLCQRLHEIGLAKVRNMEKELPARDRHNLLQNTIWPLLGFWIAGYLLLIAVRWVRDGFAEARNAFSKANAATDGA